MDRIELRDIIVYGHYGVTAAEREQGQRLLMSIRLDLDLSAAAESDDLADTVSYEDVYNAAKLLAENTGCRLLEHLAGKVAEHLLERFAKLSRARVSLRKANLPFPNTCRDVEVSLERSRVK